MAIKFLADTNIFLEILLLGNKAEACKSFLARNYGRIHISDFSLHSVGVILFRMRQETIFKAFFEDVSDNTQILSLGKEGYLRLPEIRQRFNLDFDDSYQFQVAKDYDLSIVTMDKDFDRIRGELEILSIP
jgi:predicted nucleic acid-binding protein